MKVVFFTADIDVDPGLVLLVGEAVLKGILYEGEEQHRRYCPAIRVRGNVTVKLQRMGCAVAAELFLSVQYR